MNRVPGLRWCWCAALLAWATAVSHAGTIETLDRRILEGAITLTAQGGLELRSADGRREQFSLSAIRKAWLQGVVFDLEALPKGWLAEDIGDVRGSAVEDGEKLTLKISGKAPKDPKSQALHFSYRVVRGDGGIVGKLERARPLGASVAGVMLRENLEPNGGFVLLGVTAENQLRLEWREQSKGVLTETKLGKAELPIWLRLARNQDKDKVVIGWRSRDGTNWERVGQARLNTQVTPWPAGGQHRKPLLHAGVAITSPGVDRVSTAEWGHYVVNAKGLLGEYYADDLFKDLKFTRPETKLDMTWSHKSPAPEIPPERFSARWTGQLEPRYSEPYRIYVDGNQDTHIWLAGEEIPCVPRNTKPNAYPGKEISLVAGKKYDVRIEFKKGEKPSPLRLAWSSPSQALESIPAQQLSYTYSASSPLELAASNYFVPKGIWLRNGSFLAGELVASDGSSSEIAFGGRPSLNVYNQKIAYVLFRSSRRALPFETTANKTGLILANGDFLESEFEGLKQRTLRLTSVLFGQRTFSLDKPEPLALMLNKPMPETGTTEVVLLDGSVLKAKSLQMAGDNWKIQDSALGELSVLGKEIAEIRNPVALAASRVKQ